MAGTRREFERFLAWLAERDGVSADARRVANLIHAQFGAIERTSAAQAQRSRFLVPQLIQNLDATSEELPELLDEAQDVTAQFVRLRALEVGPFRGFQQAEQFDLDARIVLFYGPNGTGKTSLCEALEFSLLGEVAEAGSQRVTQERYLRNAFSDEFSRPRLTGTTAEGAEIEIAANADAFRFCFVEKNRIDAFSRIAARSTAQKTELIAILFGLGEFAEFVRGFNHEISGQLNLSTDKGALLAQRRATLEADTGVIANAAVDDEAFAKEEQTLADEYAPGTTYAELLTLLGAPAVPGRLQHLEQVLRQPPLAEWGVTVEGITSAKSAANQQAQRVKGLSEKLQQQRGDVNFITLYEAVRQLESEEAERCPACDTPLEGDVHVLRNPFEKARSGLAELADLAALQQKHESETDELARLSTSLLVLLRRVAEFARTVEPESAAALALNDVPADPAAGWWEVVALPSGDDAVPSKWDALEATARAIEQWDESARRQSAERLDLIQERDRLNQFNVRVAQLQTRREEHAKRLVDARGRISAFDEVTRPLVAEAEEERLRIEHHTRVQSAYNEFLADLRIYRAALPATLMADLNETVRLLYNDFNRSESESNQLARLTLPVDESQGIEVTFNSHPDTPVDALKVMSEGHIRCLGLAILVAKNLKLNCPVLIFDDAVNAIDNDHRLGIRDTLFTGGQFENKQILLTCHGEELIKDIEVVIGRIAAHESCRSYTFLPHEGDRNIRVVASSTRNYVLEAQQHFAAGRVRDAIASARRAMEAINDRTWGLLVRVGLGELKLKLAKPKAPLDQNNLASVLKQALERPAFVDPRKDGLVAGYEFMLRPREWAVFNTLTHENAGSEDVPRETVRAVIENLARLDDLLSHRVLAAPAPAPV